MDCLKMHPANLPALKNKKSKQGNFLFLLLLNETYLKQGLHTDQSLSASLSLHLSLSLCHCLSVCLFLNICNTNSKFSALICIRQHHLKSKSLAVQGKGKAQIKVC